MKGDTRADEPGIELALAQRGFRGRVLTTPKLFDPDDLVDAETDAMAEEGVPDTTRASYRSDWKLIMKWCGDPDRGPGHPRSHMPMTVATVRKLITDCWSWTRTLPDGSTVLAGRYGRPLAPSTVEHRLAVISIVHQWAGLPSPTRHPSVAVQLRGYRRRWAKRGYRPDVAYAITPEDNIAMIRTCDLTTIQGVRNAALMRLQWEMGARISEVCDLRIGHLRWETEARLIVHVAMPKGDEPRDVVIEADTDFVPELCPLRLVRMWLDVLNRNDVTDGPLLREVNPGIPRKDGQLSGSLRAAGIDRHAADMVIKRAAERSGVDTDPVTKTKRHISSHGPRAGFITAGVDAGMEVAQIAAHTGHKLSSPVIHRYYRARNRGKYNVGVRIRMAIRERNTAAAAAR